MTVNGFMKLGGNLEAGFLADSTLTILRKSQKLEDKDRVVIEKGLTFLDHVLKGFEQVHTGKLQSNAVVSVDAYTRAIIALSYKDKKRSIKFEHFINIVKDELEDILEKERVAKTKTKSSKKFFKYIKEYTVYQIGRHLYEKNEDKEWLLQHL